MNIEQNSVVSVSYTLKAGLAGQPVQEIESVDTSNPLVFLFGVGMMIPGFEQNLDGMKPGDTFNFSIKPEDGYGQNDATAIVQLPIEIFKVDNAIDFEMLKKGNVLPMSDSEGNMLRGKVVSFNDKEVTMDFNHPLAGMDLHFTGSVVNVRPATVEELAHGHVHGEGGVHH